MELELKNSTKITRPGSGMESKGIEHMVFCDAAKDIFYIFGSNTEHEMVYSTQETLDDDTAYINIQQLIRGFSGNQFRPVKMRGIKQ